MATAVAVAPGAATLTPSTGGAVLVSVVGRAVLVSVVGKAALVAPAIGNATINTTPPVATVGSAVVGTSLVG